jgi:hypothetical protein
MWGEGSQRLYCLQEIVVSKKSFFWVTAVILQPLLAYRIYVCNTR